MSNTDKTTVGAWLLHHDQKLVNTSTTEFENIVTAGRSARLLSAISREMETTVSSERLLELARGIGVRRIELDGILNELTEHGLIEQSTSGVAVLGVSQIGVLKHAADIFESNEPDGVEKAVIELAELGSNSPIRRNDCQEYLGDTFKLSKTQIDDVFSHSEQIGFVDYEADGLDKLYFNGTLFKRDNAAKAKNVLDNLKSDERDKILIVESSLQGRGCLLANEIRLVLGDVLWSKLHQIGFYEVSVVANEAGVTEFVTKPEALAKYVPNGLADMLDDAKALASSLTYGIVKSDNARGRVKDPAILMGVLVSRGYVEGWANAIKQDYKILERRGVVQVTASDQGNRLTLLKTEVGNMAKDLILKGDASATVAEVLVGSSASSFSGPESTRTAERKKMIPESNTAVSRSLNILRKGRL